MPRCVLRSLDCRPNTDTKAITRSTSYAPRAGAACRVKIGTLHQPNHAGVAELADAQDLKSWVPQGACGFDTRPRHQFPREIARFTGPPSCQQSSANPSATHSFPKKTPEPIHSRSKR